MIYIIGDSHVSVFSGTDTTQNGDRHIQPEFGTCYTLKKGQLKPHINKFEQKIPFFCPIKIGSYTAYNSFNKIPKIEQVIDEYQISNSTYIFTCFGEIDIRNHIGKNAEKNNLSISDTIKICVNRYMNTILYLKNKGLKIGVYGPPASSIGWKETYGYKDVVFRNKMTLEFNEYLETQCDIYDIKFISISKEMMTSTGETDQKFIMDDIHLSQHAMPVLLKKFGNLSYE